jgi:hypothetical protein
VDYEAKRSFMGNVANSLLYLFGSDDEPFWWDIVRAMRKWDKCG